MSPPAAPQTGNVRRSSSYNESIPYTNTQCRIAGEDNALPVHNRCSLPLECNLDMAKHLSHFHPF